jgi:hypothetical protein
MLRRGRDLENDNLVGLPRCASGTPADRQDDGLARLCEGGIPLKPKCSIAAKRIRQHGTLPLLFRVHSSVLLRSKIGCGQQCRHST